MQYFSMRSTCAVITAFALTACGGAGGGGGGSSIPTEPTDPPVEVTDADYVELSDRTASAPADMTFVSLDGQTRVDGSVTIASGSGAISGGAVLNGRNIEDAIFTNPANGEFSRIFRITGENRFGVVGLDVLPGDLPAAGTTTMYNEGWVGMTAAFEGDTFVLTGDAEFTASWGGGANVDGRFFNLSGSNSGGNVGNQGTIILTDAAISGDTFSGGVISGTGIFAPLGGSGTTSQTGGTFFGPQADELGGVILIDDTTDDILIVGAFQAD